jgi:hypothetical protein
MSLHKYSYSIVSGIMAPFTTYFFESDTWIAIKLVDIGEDLTDSVGFAFYWKSRISPFSPNTPFGVVDIAYNRAWFHTD